MKADILKPSRQTILREAKDYVMIAVGMILYGIGWTVFLLPNDITTGGVPGIASIVYWATGFPVQYTYFSINFFLLLLALKLLGLKFCIKTIFGVFTLTFFLSLSSNWHQAFPFFATNLSWHASSEHRSVAAVSELRSAPTEAPAVRTSLPPSSTNTGT